MDITAAAEYCENRQSGLGRRFFQEIEAACSLLRRQPYAGKAAAAYPDLRVCQLNRFPYWLIYRLTGDVLTVLAVTHQQRHPDAWRNRVQEEPAVYRLAA